ncbi:MAG TPA: AIR synthase related protein [Tepidisphaeraceae bacterium]|nr:AIR synthase related protein [Tepidisphaeraceae bacterium]
MPAATYESSGVNYEALDAFKRACQAQAAATVSNLAIHGLAEAFGSRGDSAYLIETPDEYIAHVEEGLGSKVLVADAVYEQTGQSFYENIGIDTVAAIVNDLVTSGAQPVCVAMHAAVGDAAYLADPKRAGDLARGFARGCEMAGAAWGGGETPALRGIVEPSAAVLAGSAVGRIRPKHLRISGDVAAGDVIILLSSSGVHTNGLTLCRSIAEHLPEGYATEMDNGRTYGQALLDASVIYVPFIAACQRAGIALKYAAHITGHGWRKLMRLPEPFVYEITDIGHPPEIFHFIRKCGPVTEEEAYATFNMGAGFAAYVSPADVAPCLAAAKSCGIGAWVAGAVRSRSGRKAVEIVPLGITFGADSLKVR